MRKFFATQLRKAHMDALSINFLLGHKINDITESYIKADPSSMKMEYLKCIDYLSINNNITYDTISDKEKIELKNLRKYTKLQDERLIKIEQLLSKRSKI